MSTLVVAIDFSRAADRAVAEAGRLAVALGARVVLVHAFEALPRVPAWALSLGASYQDLGAREAAWNRQQAEELAGSFAQTLEASGLEVETVVREGDPGDVIVEAAAEHGATLVVVASHGWKGMRRFVLGSVTQTLLHQATCPVVVVPAEA